MSFESKVYGKLHESLVGSLHRVGFKHSSRLLVAYSGGLDSTALLHVVSSLEEAIPRMAIHVNHGLSEHACEWQTQCERTASELGVPFSGHLIELDASNVELGGRNARLEIFRSVMQTGDVVLTAHHANDFFETVLWQMLTGRAQIGIPACRPLGTGWLLRPFLNISREDLREFVENLDVDWIEDESNSDQSMDRNWIRHTLIPQLRTRFPRLAAQVQAMPRLFQTRYVYKPLKLDTVAISEERIRTWLHNTGLYPSDSKVAEMSRQQCARDDAQVKIELTRDLSVRRYQSHYHVVSAQGKLDSQRVIVGETKSFNTGKLSWTRGRGLREENGIEYRVGSRQPGQSIQVAGMKKKVATLMQAAKIPPWLRDSWPILFHNEVIACIPGVAIAEKYVSSSPKSWNPIWSSRQFGDDFQS